jgi:hypothetical protein
VSLKCHTQGVEFDPPDPQLPLTNNGNWRSRVNWIVIKRAMMTVMAMGLIGMSLAGCVTQPHAKFDKSTGRHRNQP